MTREPSPDHDVATGGRPSRARRLASHLRGVVAPDFSDGFLARSSLLLGAAEPAPVVGLSVGLVCAILSLLLRFAATPYIGHGEALLTAFPLVLVASLATGRLGGWTCLVVCTIGSWYLFIGDRFSFSFGPFEKGILIGTFLAGAFVIQICVLMRRMFHEIAMLRATEALLSRELEHRIKNTLTLVQGIARQTFRAERTNAKALDDFEGRIVALGAAQDLARRADQNPAGIAEIVARSLAPFCGETIAGRLVLEGPDVIVDVDTTVALFLVFHELSTNSAKYGALSVATGVIGIEWRVEAKPGSRVRLSWTERGGPETTAPTREGFGTTLLRRIVTRNLKGSLAIDYPIEGLRATLVLPIRPS